jgi:hypothetical protein
MGRARAQHGVPRLRPKHGLDVVPGRPEPVKERVVPDTGRVKPVPGFGLPVKPDPFAIEKREESWDPERSIQYSKIPYYLRRPCIVNKVSYIATKHHHILRTVVCHRNSKKNLYCQTPLMDSRLCLIHVSFLHVTSHVVSFYKYDDVTLFSYLCFSFFCWTLSLPCKPLIYIHILKQQGYGWFCPFNSLDLNSHAAF